MPVIKTCDKEDDVIMAIMSGDNLCGDDDASWVRKNVDENVLVTDYEDQ